jgi:hypothetical protein
MGVTAGGGAANTAIGADPPFVTTGLDPVVLCAARRHRRMDCRVKPGNDVRGK